MTVLEIARFRAALDIGDDVTWPFPNRNRYAAISRMQASVLRLERRSAPYSWVQTEMIGRRAA